MTAVGQPSGCVRTMPPELGALRKEYNQCWHCLHWITRGATPQTSPSDVPVGEVLTSQTVDNPCVKPAWTKPAPSPETQTCRPAKVTLAGAGKMSRIRVNILSAVGASKTVRLDTIFVITHAYQAWHSSWGPGVLCWHRLCACTRAKPPRSRRCSISVAGWGHSCKSCSTFFFSSFFPIRKPA